MGFQKMQPRKYPPRLWALVGYPGSGKSTFVTAMRQPILAVDADHRFSEVLHLAKDTYELSPDPEDNTDADRITARLAENMPGTKVATIAVDSLTAIITPLVVQAIVDKELGRERNLMSGFKGKAMAMRQLQDAVSRWGTDVIWVYHLMDARDEKSNKLVRATVSQTELARLTRSINMQLELVQDKETGQHGVKVVWARRGRSGMTLWDAAGNWQGVPEEIEEAVYDGLTEEEQAKIESDPPKVFANPETAIEWGFRKGVFHAIEHARNAYNKIKEEKKPRTALEMRDLWVADVQARLEHVATGNGDPDSKQSELPF